MTSTLSRAPLTKINLARSYAAAAAACKVSPIGGFPEYKVESRKANKLIIAGADTGAAISRVAIAFRAGARDETSFNLGAAHVLRACAGNSTKNLSQLAISRIIQQLGGSLTVHADREVICYVLEGTRECIKETLPILGEVATQPAFKPWEVKDLSSRLQVDRMRLSPQLRTIDIFHKAAYRKGLGNSLYIPRYQIGKINAEAMQEFFSETCTPERGAMIHLGYSTDQLVHCANKFQFCSASGKATPGADYKGGEVRLDKGGDYAYVMIGGEGCPANASAVGLVLKRALGGAPQVTYGNTAGPLKSVISPKSYGMITTLNFSYTDTGLIGVLLAVPSADAGNAVKNLVKALGGTLSDQDVSRAKASLTRSILGESPIQALHRLAWQAVQCPTILPPDARVKEIEGVTTQQVNDLLKKVTGKLSMAAFGQLACVPYLDEIKSC